ARGRAGAGMVGGLGREELAGRLGGGVGGCGRAGGVGGLGGVGGVGGVGRLAPGPVVLAGSGALAGPVGLVGLAGLFGRVGCVGCVGRVGPGGRLRRVAQLEHRGGLVDGPLGGPERGEHGGGLVDGALAAAGLVPALGLSAVVVPAVPAVPAVLSVLSVLSALSVLVGAGRAVVVPVVPGLAVLPVLPVLAVGVGRVVGGGRGRDIAVVGGVRCVLGRVRGPGGGRGGLGSVLGRRDHVGVGPVGGSVVQG